MRAKCGQNRAITFQGCQTPAKTWCSCTAKGNTRLQRTPVQAQNTQILSESRTAARPKRRRTKQVNPVAVNSEAAYPGNHL